MYRPYTLGSGDFAPAPPGVAISGHYYRHRKWWMMAAAMLALFLR